MFIANTLRNKNRAEYLLYMWQVEDIIRANNCDIDTLKTNYLSRFEVSDEQRRALEQWYTDLIEMMHAEGVTEKGHLQINKNVIASLTELHVRLLNSSAFPYYKSAYYKALPYIVEIRNRGDKEATELENCFDMLYGVMLLRLQKKAVSKDTETAVKDVTTFLGMLSDYYLKDKETPLESD